MIYRAAVILHHLRHTMDSDTMKKAGVVAIILLLALYCAGYGLMIFIIDAPIFMVVLYGVIATIIIIVLAYEGWLRFKEIDEGLEDAVNDY